MPEAKNKAIAEIISSARKNIPVGTVFTKYHPTRITEVTEQEKTYINFGNWMEGHLATICEECKHEYYKHPTVVGVHWLHKLCDGTFVKL